MNTISYRYNDGGRAAAGYKGDAGDCVVRAFCILTGMSYREAYKLFTNANKEYGYSPARNGVSVKVSRKVFQEQGLIRVRLGRGAKPTYTEAHERYGDCIVKTRKHLSAIIDGALQDTFDGRGYWWNESMGKVVGYNADDKPEYEAIWRERKATSVWILPKGKEIQ